MIEVLVWQLPGESEENRESHAMKMYEGVEIYLDTYLTSALHGGVWLGLPPRKKPRWASTLDRGGWVGSKAALAL
jgi:hypothetical protein